MLSLPVAQASSSPARGGGPLPALSELQPSSADAAPPEPSLVVFSGGTAFNSVAGHMRQLTTRIAHVLPVSDDGGSTAEIVRVLGGPAVGDIRSRCLRLAGAPPLSNTCASLCGRDMLLPACHAARARSSRSRHAPRRHRPPTKRTPAWPRPVADDSDEEARAVRRLLAHRLSSSDSAAAKQEWYGIVEGDDPLWEVRGGMAPWL